MQLLAPSCYVRIIAARRIPAASAREDADAMTTTTHRDVPVAPSNPNGTSPQDSPQPPPATGALDQRLHNVEHPSALIEKVGAIERGHFKYESGRHGDIYVEKFRLLEHPATAASLGHAIAGEFSYLDSELVVGPTTGGWLLAHETARALSDNSRAFCAESKESGGREFRRGFAFDPGQQVIVVDDVLTTGGSLRDTIKAVRDAGGEPVAVGVIVDRTNGAAAPKGKFDGLPFFAYLSITAASYAPGKGKCPLCDADVPLTET